MVKGFRDFLMRGNVVDLAVAVVIGAAFGAIVTAFTKSIVQPIINALGGSGAAQGLGFKILSDNDATFVDIGTVITAIINFVITAAVVYFIFVVPMNEIQKRRKAGAEPEPAAPAEDVLLLQEIRDLLRERNNA